MPVSTTSSVGPYLSWLFIPFGLIVLCPKRDGKLVLAVFVSLVVAYGMYWPGSWLYGPRYYYEGLPSLAICCAAGIARLGGWLGDWHGDVRWRPAIGVWHSSSTCNNEYRFLYSSSGLGDARPVPDHA